MKVPKKPSKFRIAQYMPPNPMGGDMETGTEPVVTPVVRWSGRGLPPKELLETAADSTHPANIFRFQALYEIVEYNPATLLERQDGLMRWRRELEIARLAIISTQEI